MGISRDCPNFYGYRLLSQERERLRISNLGSTFRVSIWTKAHEKFRRKGIVGVSIDCPFFSVQFIYLSGICFWQSPAFRTIQHYRRMQVLYSCNLVLSASRDFQMQLSEYAATVNVIAAVDWGGVLGQQGKQIHWRLQPGVHVRPEPPDLTDEYTEHGRKIIVIGQFTFVKDIVTCFFSETQCIITFWQCDA